MKFKKNYKSLFLDQDSPIETINEKVNIILSPTLYWVKKISLPVKDISSVKKLLPSLFEDILPTGNYSYMAYKSNGLFFIFAYEDKKILDLISQKGISSSDIAAVYFAQTELNNITDAIKINESQSITLKDEVVIVLPSAWTKGDQKLNLSLLSPSKHSITLQQFGHVLDSKSLTKIGLAMIVLIFILATQYYITNKKISNISKLKSELFTEYNLKSTMLQNRAILKKYNSIYKTQIKLRKYIHHILTIKLKDKEKLTKLSFKNNSLQAEFSGVIDGKESHITQILKNNKINFKSLFKNKSLHVEVSL